MVVVKASKMKFACSIFLDKGVAEYERRAFRRWPRMVVLPAPDSPLRHVSIQDAQPRMVCDIQKHNCLVLGPLAQAHVCPLGKVFGGLLGAPVLAAIRALAGVLVCVQGDDGMRGERGGSELLVEAAGEVGGQVCVGL